MPKLATLIKAARARDGFSQTQAAAAWGFELRALQGWEQDQRSPRGPALEKLLSIIMTGSPATKPAKKRNAKRSRGSKPQKS